MARPTDRERSPLSEALIQLRQTLGHSQQQFASRTGLAVTTIARYETSRPPRGRELGIFHRLAVEAHRPDIAAAFGEAMADELSMKAERIPRTIEESILADLLFLMMRNRQHSPAIGNAFRKTIEQIFRTFEVLKTAFRGGERVFG